MIRALFFFLLFISSITNQVFSEIESLSLAHLHDDAIKKHSKSIKQELSRTRLYKRIIVGAGIGALTYGTYYLFFRDPASVAQKMALQEQGQEGQPGQNIKKVTHDDILKKIEAGHIDKQHMKSVVDFIERQRAATGFGCTLKSWAATTANIVLRESAVALVFSGVMGAFGKYFKFIDKSIDAATGKVFHADTLSWYLTAHTTIFSLLNDLEWHAHCIEKKALPKKAFDGGSASLSTSGDAELSLQDEHVAYHVDLFIKTWALCIHNFESILGFMVMKMQALSIDIETNDTKNAISDGIGSDTEQEKKKVLVGGYDTIIKNLYETVHTCRNKLEEILLKNDHAGLIMEVNRLRTLFMEKRAAFIACENHE